MDVGALRPTNIFITSQKYQIWSGDVILGRRKVLLFPQIAGQNRIRIDKNSTDLEGFIFQRGVPNKSPHGATALVMLYFEWKRLEKKHCVAWKHFHRKLTMLHLWSRPSWSDMCLVNGRRRTVLPRPWQHRKCVACPGCPEKKIRIQAGRVGRLPL